MAGIGVNKRLVFVLLCAVSVAACGGGSGGHGAQPVPTSSADGADASAQATFVLTIPKSANSRKRHPAYVSASTQSFAFTLTASNALTPQQVTAYPANDFDITLGSATCPGSGPWTCTFTTSFPRGNDTISIVAYAGTGEGGAILSSQSVAVTLVQGVANSFPVTLDAQVGGTSSCPSPAIVVGSPAGGAQCSGSSAAAIAFSGTAPLTFPLTLKDAAGNTIAPTASGAPAITVSTTGSITTSVTPSSNPAQITLVPNGTAGAGTMTVTASGGTNAAGDGIAARSVTVSLQADAQPGTASCPSPSIVLGTFPTGASGSECSGSAGGTISVSGTSALTFPVTLKNGGGIAVTAGSAGAPVLAAAASSGATFTVSTTQNPYAVTITPVSGGSGGTVTLTASGAVANDGVTPTSIALNVNVTPYWSYGDQPMPTQRYGIFGGTIGSTIYVAGGTYSTPLSTLEAYNAASDSWTTLTSMPTARQSAAAGVNGTTLYVAGGNNASYAAQKNAYAYNSTAGTWSTLASMPTARYGVGGGVIGGIFYVVGGFTGAVDSNKLEAYDPSSNTWATKAVMPTARDYPAAVVYNNILYVIGGNNGNYLTTVEAYDPSSNTWSTKASMPTALESQGAAVFNNLIYVTGGASYALGYVGIVQVYNPATNTWSTTTSLQDAHSDNVTAVANGKLFVIGGETNSGPNNEVEVLNP